MGFIGEPEWIVKLPSAETEGWTEKIRRQLRTAVSESNNEERSGLILSLLIGERYRLPREQTESFRKSGVAHILAISGLHVALVAFLFLGLFRVVASLPVFSRSVLFLRLSPLLAILPVWLFVAVAGFPVSAVRAAVMATFVLAAISFWERLDLLSTLALAAFLILCLSPLSLFSASFQLSFMAVLFLILFFPRWLEKRKQWEKIPKPLSSPVTASSQVMEK